MSGFVTKTFEEWQLFIPITRYFARMTNITCANLISSFSATIPLHVDDTKIMLDTSCRSKIRQNPKYSEIENIDRHTYNQIMSIKERTDEDY